MTLRSWSSLKLQKLPNQAPGSTKQILAYLLSEQADVVLCLGRDVCLSQVGAHVLLGIREQDIRNEGDWGGRALNVKHDHRLWQRKSLS
jgi:hypothetical protein